MSTLAIDSVNDATQLAVRWFEEVWNERKTETIWELLTDKSVCESEGGRLEGPKAFIEQAYIPLTTAFPDLRVTVLGTVTEGDQVALRWSVSGTHTGEGLGIPPAGHRITIRGMTWLRCHDGKLLEGLDCWNRTGFLQALQGGDVPPSASLT